MYEPMTDEIIRTHTTVQRKPGLLVRALAWVVYVWELIFGYRF